MARVPSDVLASLDDEQAPYIMVEPGAAVWLDDDRRRVYDDGPPLTPFWALSPEEQQAQLRAEAERRSKLVQARGVYDDILGRPGPAEDDPRYEVDGEYDPRADLVTAATLQREVRIAGKGGGGSKGRASRKSAVAKNKRALEPIPDRIVQSHLPTLRVARLTVHTYEYFFNQPDVARAVLSEYADEVLANGYPRGPFPRFSELRTTTRPLLVIGLSARKIDALKANPGAAKRKLIEHARRSQLDRAKLIDGG